MADNNEEIDFLRRFLSMVMSASEGSFTEDMAMQVENQIRQEYGGEDVWIGKHTRPSRESKEKAVKEYLSGKPVEEVTTKNGISRATLYRHLKQR